METFITARVVIIIIIIIIMIIIVIIFIITFEMFDGSSSAQLLFYVRGIVCVPNTNDYRSVT
jgi:hypothetical protein